MAKYDIYADKNSNTVSIMRIRKYFNFNEKYTRKMISSIRQTDDIHCIGNIGTVDKRELEKRGIVFKLISNPYNPDDHNPDNLVLMVGNKIKRSN